MKISQSTKNAIIIGSFIFMGILTVGIMNMDDPETESANTENKAKSSDTAKEYDQWLDGALGDKEDLPLSQSEKPLNEIMDSILVSEPIQGDP